MIMMTMTMVTANTAGGVTSSSMAAQVSASATAALGAAALPSAQSLMASAGLASASSGNSGAPNSGKVAKAAKEFETQLIEMLLQETEKTFAELPGDSSIPGADNYNYLGTQAMASMIADGGGFGIAKMISAHLGTRK
jgi:Rod binding domain-containing protein